MSRGPPSAKATARFAGTYTWGWTDHILEETPESQEDLIAGMLGGRTMASLSAQQQEQIQNRATQLMSRRQRVPMMRVMSHQNLPVVRVMPYNGFQRNRF